MQEVRRLNKGGAGLDGRLQILERAAKSPILHVVGIDADSHAAGLAGWSLGDREPLWVGSTSVSAAGVLGAEDMHSQARALLEGLPVSHQIGHRVLIVVETMRIRRAAGAETRNPQSLVDLSFFAGLLAATALARWPGSILLPVEPMTWKGNTPKKIHHSRLLTQMGWPAKVLSDYARPVRAPQGVLGAGQLKPSDWKHVMDGVGLAKWGVEQLEQTMGRLKRKR